MFGCCCRQLVHNTRVYLTSFHNFLFTICLGVAIVNWSKILGSISHLFIHFLFTICLGVAIVNWSKILGSISHLFIISSVTICLGVAVVNWSKILGYISHLFIISSLPSVWVLLSSIGAKY